MSDKLAAVLTEHTDMLPGPPVRHNDGIAAVPRQLPPAEAVDLHIGCDLPQAGAQCIGGFGTDRLEGAAGLAASGLGDARTTVSLLAEVADSLMVAAVGPRAVGTAAPVFRTHGPGTRGAVQGVVSTEGPLAGRT